MFIAAVAKTAVCQIPQGFSPMGPARARRAHQIVCLHMLSDLLCLARLYYIRL